MKIVIFVILSVFSFVGCTVKQNTVKKPYYYNYDAYQHQSEPMVCGKDGMCLQDDF